MTKLSPANLSLMSVPSPQASRIAVPEYDRTAVTPGIVHLSVGGFHRAHEAMYVDALMNRGQAMDWGIIGVGLLESNARMRDVMREQDCLYTLVVKHNDGTWDPRVIGSMIGYLFAPDDPEAVVAAMADPRIRIVSLTVTEGGYTIDAVTGEFAADDAAVQADLQPGAVPHTMFGLVVEALARRRDAGQPAFSIVSCDNIQGNGHVAHRVFTAFARLRDPALAQWIEANVRFPNSMVDRITPQTSEKDRLELARRFDVEDGWPVLCEPFCQWVLEGDFSSGRPPLEPVGVQIVDDVEPYELMKLRLLNASHQALCYPGYLVGYRYAHEVTSDPLFAGYLVDYMTQEAIPTLRAVPGIDLHGYVAELIERFSNPEVADTLERLCQNTSDLIPKFLLPVIREQLAVGGPITRSVAAVVSWARYAKGADEAGATYELDDALAVQLRAAADRSEADPMAFLTDNRQLFGELADDPRFTTVYVALLRSVQAHGIRATWADLDAIVATVGTVGTVGTAERTTP